MKNGINHSVEETVIFSSSLKLGNITPIFKKDDHLDKSNYRPVSILPLLSKVYERIISKGSFKRYVTPEGRGRVVNFVTNRYGNQAGGEGVSVMPLRNVDKCFYMADFTRNLPIGSYSLYYLTSKTLVFR